MSGDFLDSNVILYAIGKDDAKTKRAQEILTTALSGDACISFQVVQEVLNVLTRSPEAESDSRRALDDILMPMWRVMPSASLYEAAVRIHLRYQYRFYDSLIIAAASEAGCSRLLSEDLQHGQRLEGLTIENPFLDLHT